MKTEKKMVHPAEQKPSTEYAAECQAKYEREGFADFDIVADAAAAMQESAPMKCGACGRWFPEEDVENCDGVVRCGNCADAS